MKTKLLSKFLFSMIILFAIAGCRGCDNDVQPTQSTTVPSQPTAVPVQPEIVPVQPTTAKVKISGRGANEMINGIKVVLSLPSGVTVRSTADAINPSVLVTDAGVVAASGVAKNAMTPIATYRVASGAAPGKVTISMISAGGFGTGEFVTITCEIAAGHYPKAPDFSVTNFNAVDRNGTPIEGLTAKLAVDIH